MATVDQMKPGTLGGQYGGNINAMAADSMTKLPTA
jgi:hypothetical protein